MVRNGSQRRSFKGGRVGFAKRSRIAFGSRSRRTGIRSGTFVTSNPRSGGFIDKEVKFYDTSLAGQALSAVAAMTGGELDPSATVMLNTVDQGDGEQQRDGRKILMKSVYITGTVTVAKKESQNDIDNAGRAYIALVLDTQTNGAQLDSEKVFENQSANTILNAHPMRNLQFTRRFKVLGHKMFTFGNITAANDTGSTGGIVMGGLSRNFKFFKNLNIPCNFTGTASTVANIMDNSLHIVGFSTGTALAPTISYNARLRFVG